MGSRISDVTVELADRSERIFDEVAAILPLFRSGVDPTSEYGDKPYDELVTVSLDDLNNQMDVSPQKPADQERPKEATKGRKTSKGKGKTDDLPTRTLQEGWTEEELHDFTKGLKKHKKDFWAIQKEFLSHKNMKDIIFFYYIWKRSNKVKGCEKSRAKIVRYMAMKRTAPDFIFNSKGSTGILTRSKRKREEKKNGSA